MAWLGLLPPLRHEENDMARYLELTEAHEDGKAARSWLQRTCFRCHKDEFGIVTNAGQASFQRTLSTPREEVDGQSRWLPGLHSAPRRTVPCPNSLWSSISSQLTLRH